MDLRKQHVTKDELFSERLEELIELKGLDEAIIAFYVQFAMAWYSYLRKNTGAKKNLLSLSEIIENILEYSLEKKEKKNFNEYLNRIREVKEFKKVKNNHFENIHERSTIVSCSEQLI